MDTKEKIQKPWTLRQVKFVAEYLISNNATQAAIKAGYSEKTAKEIGYENLTRPHIAAAIAEKTKKINDACEVTVEKTLRHQAAMSYSNILDYLEFDKQNRPHVALHKITRDQGAAVKTIKITELPPMKIVSNGEELEREVLRVELTLHDKPRTNEAVMKHLGILAPDVGAASHGGDTNIQNNYYMNMPPLEIMKRMALLMYRQQMPTPPQPSGGNNSGMVAKSPTGSKDKG